MTPLSFPSKTMNKPKLPFNAYVFLGWLAFMTVFPFLIILGMSFLSKSPTGAIELIPTLSNYSRCFEFVYFQVFLKTFWLALTATASCLLVGFPIAYFLSKLEGSSRQVGLVLIFIPFWTNFILRVHGMISILGNHGLLNQVLITLGITQEPIQILYTRLGVYLGLVYNYLPFLVVPIYSALEKLDPALREAAFDLGAGRVKSFLYVILPNVKEGVFTGSLFVFVPMLGEYVIPDLLGGAKESFLGNVMVSQFFALQDWPFGSACAGLLSFFLLLALWVHLKKETSNA